MVILFVYHGKEDLQSQPLCVCCYLCEGIKCGQEMQINKPGELPTCSAGSVLRFPGCCHEPIGGGVRSCVSYNVATKWTLTFDLDKRTRE